VTAFRVTRGWLAAEGACESGVAAFLASYPDGAELTRGLLDDPVAAPHLRWLAEHLPLLAEPRRVYGLAMAEARRVYYLAMAEALWTAIVASGR
jgi:hypothetical protein